MAYNKGRGKPERDSAPAEEKKPRKQGRNPGKPHGATPSETLHPAPVEPTPGLLVARRYRDPEDYYQPTKVELDPSSLFELARQGITQRSTAALLRVSQSYLEKELAKPGESRNAWEAGLAGMEMSIKQWQLYYAQQGNSQLLVWLGKNGAHQTDLKAVELTGADGGPIRAEVDLRGLILQKIAEKRRSVGATSS